MGLKSAIEWTDATYNPWHGCHKISQGCKICYMFTEKARFGQNPNLVVRSKTTFRDPLKWKEPRRIFTCSWSDFFIEEADAWRQEVWDIIDHCQQHTFLILTKRPERIVASLPLSLSWPWPHVWLGVSVESPDYLWRIHRLQEVPTAIRFISVEPLIAAIPELPLAGISLVIVGAESGPGARSMEIDWVREIRDQCQAAGVAFFYKQAAVNGQKISTPMLDGRRWLEFPERR